jgi:hypothetical protein
MPLKMTFSSFPHYEKRASGQSEGSMTWFFSRQCNRIMPVLNRVSLVLAFLLPLPAIGQNLYLYPTTAVAPLGSYQTLTAIISGVSDKTVTWRTDGGTLVGTNPCVVNEPCTIALYTTTAGTYHVTATSNANGSIAATSTITFTASPTPATTHPRLVVTAAMLPALQAKTTSGNTIYQALYKQAFADYTSDNAVWSWSCNGGTGLPSTSEATNWEEQNAYLYAFMSMIDPSDPTYKWGCYGRDVWTYVMTEVMNGGDTSFGANEWSVSSPYYAFTTDYLMAGGYLSTTDQAQARAFLAFMARSVLANSVGDAWSPTLGSYNSPAEFDTGSVWDLTAMRAMGNNYTESKLLYLVAASLTFNDNTTDDPPLANTCNATRYQVCPDYSAGSLHAYWQYFVGAPLYMEWAHLEDPNVSWQAYQAFYGNLPTQPICYNTDQQDHPCFGDGRGGEPSEGSWYDYSLYRLRYAMNAIHTAGYDDPLLYGPQISLENSSWWDLKYVSDLEFLTGFGPYNGESGTSGGTPAYTYLTTGDSNTYYRMPSDMWTESATLVADTYTGRTDRSNALTWGILNTAFGGPLGTLDDCNEYCGFTQEMSNPRGQSVDEDLFIALPAGDPTVSLPSDPRPSFPTDLYNGSFNQHIMVRNSWSANDTLFSYYCPNTLIDHEHEFCGRFDIFSNNEYITKGRTEFTDYNDAMSTASQQGVQAILNTTGTSCTVANGCPYAPAFTDGGQMWHSYQAGLVTLQHEELPAYVAAIVDDTNEYNGSAAQFPDYNDVQAASRSLLYLRASNQVVFYDRSITSHAASKALYQNTTGALSISANTASWPTRSGTQNVYFTSLLPSGATISDAGLTAGGPAQSADWEPYTTLEVNAGTPSSTQFLSVMQWGESSFTPVTATLVQSTSGNNFDGTVLGSSVAMFMRAWPATFTGVTYPASGGSTQYVSDLTPNAMYSIIGDETPSSATADAAGVLVFSASGTGDISIASVPFSLVSISVTPPSSTLAVGGSQQYTAACTYSNGLSENCTTTVSWTSSAIGVATVSSVGVVTGVTLGAATIIATSGTIQGQTTVTISAAGPAATPGFSPVAGTYTSAQTVTINSTTPAATIYYTTNGTTATTSSTIYSAPITISSSETVEAIAVASGYSNSAVGSAAYTINLPATAAATPGFSPAAGTYTSAQTVTITSATPAATIYYTTNGTTPTTSSTLYSGPIIVSSSETVEAIAMASGYSNSAVGSAAYTINLSEPAAATPGFSPAAGTYTSAQTVTISSATPAATIYYTTNGTTPSTSSTIYSAPIAVSSSETVEAIAVASGYTNSAVGSGAYTISEQTAATPGFNPAAGTYTTAQTVTISSATPAATIYYTTNGTTPTASSTVYSGPITISSSETVKAIAVTSGYSNSAVGAAAYAISFPAPSFSVAVSPGALDIIAGQTGNAAVLVTPLNSFSSPVSLSCTGLPSGASCNFSPATVTPSGAEASATLTVVTSMTAVALSHSSRSWLPGSVLAVTFFSLGWRKKGRLYVLLVLGLCGASLCTGCGAIVLSSAQQVTQPTTSTVTVIATSGSLQQSTSLTLTVQ